jgi:hypothetical protein
MLSIEGPPRGPTSGEHSKTPVPNGGRACLSHRRTHIKVALLYAVTADVLALRRRLEACPGLQVTVFADRVVGTEWDVLAVDATSTNLAAVEFALREWEAMGTPEIVVAPTKPCASIAAALAHFGVRNIMTLESACAWMPHAVRALADLARARRAERRALDALAKVPPPVPCSASSLHPLFGAESSFRETYLRMLVARNSTLREAAAAAGIPYRSLLRMLTTYGIRREDCPPCDMADGSAAFALARPR